MRKLVLGTTAVLLISTSAILLLRPLGLKTSSTVEQANNPAFRDGLVLGKLAAENGNKLRAPKGRWARAEDQASFTAAYEQAYNEALGQQTKELKQAER